MGKGYLDCFASSRKGRVGPGFIPAGTMPAGNSWRDHMLCGKRRVGPPPVHHTIAPSQTEFAAGAPYPHDSWASQTY